MIQARNRAPYVFLGPLGKAFVARHEGGKPTVLLIDEIDKGDIDFPNDLLLELDEMRFQIMEMDNTFIKADKKRPPLVFITSNDERELPPAFLRRCLYYRIPSFDQKLLEKIARSKLKEFYAELKIDKKDLLSRKDVGDIVARFRRIKKSTASIKPPSTSELLDWLKIITFKLNQNEESISLSELLDDKQIKEMALKLM